jgi:hypothetical protein
MTEFALTDRPPNWIHRPHCSSPVAELVDLLAETARSLATKGFCPDEPIPGDRGCSLTVRSHSFGLEAKIGCTLSPDGPFDFRWSSVVTSDHAGVVADSGKFESREEARDTLAAFVSVISTVASFH